MRPTASRLGIVTAALASVLLPSPACAEDAFESPPERSATQILGAEHVSGPGYTIREKVVARGFLQHFEVESKFGLYQAGSRRLLEARLREIETMQRLLQMGGASAYVKALENKLVELPTSLVQVAKNPVKAVGNVPKALTKTFGRVGSLMGSAGKRGSKGSGLSPDELREGLVAAEKRRLAAELKVDVYSSNPKLQQLLQDVATARYAGELTVSLASMAIPGGAGTALYSTASYNTQILTLLADKTEKELFAHNRATLLRHGAHPFLVDKFMAAPHLSPRHQTTITTAFTALRGVRGADAILQAALEATDEPRALLQEQQAAALAGFHAREEPLVRLHAVGGVVLARTRGGAGVVVAPLDLLWYDAASKQVIDLLARAPLWRGATRRTVYVKGPVTQRASDTAKAAGVPIVSGWAWMGDSGDGAGQRRPSGRVGR